MNVSPVLQINQGFQMTKGNICVTFYKRSLVQFSQWHSRSRVKHGVDLLTLLLDDNVVWVVTMDKIMCIDGCKWNMLLIVTRKCADYQYAASPPHGSTSQIGAASTSSLQQCQHYVGNHITLTPGVGEAHLIGFRFRFRSSYRIPIKGLRVL